MSKIKRKFHKAGRKIRKHSPAILMASGIVGFIGFGVTMYKAQPKIEEIVEEVEAKQEAGEEVDKMAVVKRTARALALPVALGVVSTAAMVWSYKIQTNRIVTLSGALAATQAAHRKLQNKIKTKLGEEEYKKFVTTDEVVTKTVDDEGNEAETVEKVKAEIDSTLGEWFSESSEYASDSLDYNLQWIESKAASLDLKLFGRGTLLLNEVRDSLGFPRIRMGALLGWSTAGQVFSIDTMVYNEEDPITHELKPNIRVSWTPPQYIYDEVEYPPTFDTW